MLTPTLDEARAQADGFTHVPVALELYADLKTPLEVFRSIRDRNQKACILESAPDGESWGRHTFLAYAPILEATGTADGALIRENGRAESRAGDPGRMLRELLRRYRSPRLPDLPFFTGGFVGYFAYEYFCRSEPKLKLTERDEIGLPDFHLMLFDKVIAFDHFRQKIFLIVNIGTDRLEKNYDKALETLRDMEKIVLAPPPPVTVHPPRPAAPYGFRASFSRESFCAAVEKARHYIREGDIFQCVPSIRFSAPYRSGLLGAYRVLRTNNPSAYMFHICFDDLELAGASPETLVSLRDGVVSTYPLAGTCPRTEDERETADLVAQMLADEKELAEHDMLVDLGRNDLGKISRFGSVAVGEYRGVKKLSQVCHIASRVTGRLAEGCDAFDVIAAVLPAGTLSGAPKKRACEIIDELEGMKRGVYGGAVGYIDFTGNMDFCIGIRMAVLKDGVVHVQAGAGIVEGSVPEKEYEECRGKARAVLEAVQAGEGGAL
ncbi:MAG: anthranilate synthase component I family protein [Gracilibacteraceae bacterium]|jgi:anthranilate synthase component 1|nr:anthranilate synthase component I family protein [Gracilibacteraceae bacterium]